MEQFYRLSQTCILLLFFVFAFQKVDAHQVYGKVSDETGQPLPYVNVYLENSTYGVVSNLKGEYYMNLSDGSYKLVFSFIGYEKKSKDILVAGKDLIVNITMAETSLQLGGITVMANGKDPAYAIIREAIDHKDEVLNQDFTNARSEYYLKLSLEQESVQGITDTAKKTVRDTVKKANLNFNETFATLYFEKPSNYKEIIHAQRDLVEKKDVNVVFDVSIGNNDDDYKDPPATNPYTFYTSPVEVDFNFYNNLINVPALSATPLVSPLSNGAFASYHYKLLETFVENGTTIHKIEVIPRRSPAALFNGVIFISEGSWKLMALELNADPKSIMFFKDFKIIQNFELINDKYWMPVREEFYYNAYDGKNVMIGNTIVVYSDYQFNNDLAKNFFNGEITRYDDDAYLKSANYWGEKRPMTLKSEEVKFIHAKDSQNTYLKSPEYLAEVDSMTNHHDIWDYLLNGLSFRNGVKKRNIYIGSVLSGINLFSVGLIRYNFNGQYAKTFKNETRISTDFDLNYGFLNADMVGGGTLSYLYNPKKFASFRASAGERYRQLNNYESITGTFSPSNYKDVVNFGFGHTYEVKNGILTDFDFGYQRQESVIDMKYPDWYNKFWGKLQTPQEFSTIYEVVFKGKINIRFKQKYKITPLKKEVYGSKYPKMRLDFKWGIPKLLNSNVNFSFLELIVWDDIKFATMGQSRYRFSTGSFLNSKAFQLADYKFFRSSDSYFFSSPLNSFQSLYRKYNNNNPYYTTGYFAEGHYLHNFNGAIMRKIPLLKYLKLQTLGGAGFLYLEDIKMVHTEVFFGLEKPFRIRKQYFKIGVYYVNSVNSAHGFDQGFKFGIDFYNASTKSWSY